jgi:F-type H+-transporting ATPase subunit delta
MPLVEKRYAEAFFGLSEQKNAIDRFGKDLAAIAAIYQSEPGLVDFLHNPKYAIQIKRRVLTNIFNGRVEKESLSFLLLLLDKNRVKFLPGIYREFIRMADEKENILNIRIQTAMPLDQKDIDRICEKFKAAFRCARVKATVKVDPSLIGGIAVTVGDRLYDSTVKGKLSRLQSFVDA